MNIAVLLSGGVDSSVAAILLKEKGFRITGLTMVNWDRNIVTKAAEAARLLGIEHRVVDLRAVFTNRVIDYFCTAYEKGETPNPCIECNKGIKFGALFDIAGDIRCDKIATGHYAQIEFANKENRFLLKKGIDNNKDQSYFLYGLNQDQLSRALFPLGNMSKEKVKKIAIEYGIKNINEESQEICFISGDYRDFINERIVCYPGEIVDLKNNVLGIHRGLAFYTIGQRKGLGISVGHPVYVVNMDMHNNRLIVDTEEHLYSDSLVSIKNNFVSIEKFEGSLEVEAKIRYKANPAKAIINMDKDQVRVKFDKPQRAITRGQSIVYYRGDYVLGGGIIV